MAPLPPLTSSTNLTNILTTLTKRYTSSSSECAYYNTSCSTHRLAIMVIIICVGVLISAVLSLLYVRSRRSKTAKLRATMQQQRIKANDAWLVPALAPSAPRYSPREGDGAPPPPYEPRKPEPVARGVEAWR